MEKFLPRIWVFILAFGFGLSISAIWRIYTLPVLPEPVVVTKPPVTVRERPKLVEGAHGCGAAAGGRAYHYDDGGWVSAKCTMFKSPWGAAQELEGRLKGSTVSERSLTLDAEGNPVEEILIIAPQIVRIRRNGKLLCSLEASSLYHLNLFWNQTSEHKFE